MQFGVILGYMDGQGHIIRRNNMCICNDEFDIQCIVGMEQNKCETVVR